MKSGFLYIVKNSLNIQDIIIIEIDITITNDAADILSYILWFFDNNATINHTKLSIKVIAYSFKATAIIFSMTDCTRLFNTNIILSHLLFLFLYALKAVY